MKPLLLSFVFILFCTIAINAQTSFDYFSIPKHGSPVERYLLDINKDSLYNNSMVNMFFADEVGTYFNDDQDLSTQQYYTSLSTKDNSFSFAYTFNPCFNCGKLDKLNQIATIGFKAQSNNNFAELYKDGNYTASNVGITIKYAKIFNGIINYQNKFGKNVNYHQSSDNNKALDTTTSIKEKYHEEILRSYREELKQNMNDEFKKYIEESYPKDASDIERLTSGDDEAIKNAKCEFLEEKVKEFYIKMASAELDYVKKNKLYNSLNNAWFNFNLYIPINSNKYDLYDRSTETITDKRFYPIGGSVAFTLYKRWSSGRSLYFTPRISIKNNNTILANAESKTIFQTSEQFGNGILLTQKEAYNVDYKSFMTSTVQLELVFFVYKDLFGISPAIERNFGEFRSVSWKLGIPVSLKDKEGKPTVNFELQWKEIRILGKKSNHFVGISANFLFGKFLN
ncbi:hypothetical protein [Kordia sp.]|uniref:hypothetical protein n=1 Tax=Kordia sp. TaxID=1965332 RepID=UPI003D2960DB